MRASKISTNDLIHYFRQGIKTSRQLKVGIEWEKIGIEPSSGKAITYSGPRGVETIFRELVQRNQWVPELQNGRAIALHKKGASITLEPGGQIELSGQTYTLLSENEREILDHLAEIRLISEPLGIAWLGLGAQPVSTADEIEWVPKERYRVMREQLAGSGRLTYSMMKETASIQVSLDYTSEADAMEKFRLALRLTPFLTAMLANSPVEAGRRCDVLSRRSLIWSQTAPERTGLPDALLRENASFADYTEFALGVPVLFLVRGERWIAVKNRTFHQYLRDGYEGLEATPEDWELHLTGIFTEARLKHYVEIRSIDCQQTRVGLAAAAFLKGLFYDDEARRKALGLIGSFEPSAIRQDIAAARSKGLSARFSGRSALEMSRELVRLAGGGLSRYAREAGLPDETFYLAPLEEIVMTGRTPAEKLLSCVCGNTSDSLRRIIDCARI